MNNSDFQKLIEKITAVATRFYKIQDQSAWTGNLVDFLEAGDLLREHFLRQYVAGKDDSIKESLELQSQLNPSLGLSEAELMNIQSAVSLVQWATGPRVGTTLEISRELASSHGGYPAGASVWKIYGDTFYRSRHCLLWNETDHRDFPCILSSPKSSLLLDPIGFFASDVDLEHSGKRCEDFRSHEMLAKLYLVTRTIEFLRSSLKLILLIKAESIKYDKTAATSGKTSIGTLYNFYRSQSITEDMMVNTRCIVLSDKLYDHLSIYPFLFGIRRGYYLLENPYAEIIAHRARPEHIRRKTQAFLEPFATASDSSPDASPAGVIENLFNHFPQDGIVKEINLETKRVTESAQSGPYQVVVLNFANEESFASSLKNAMGLTSQSKF